MMKTFSDGIEMLYAKDRQAWRDWLEKNHEAKRSVWFVFKRRADGTRNVAYAEAVEEALCFGWIDSRVKKLDDVRTIQYFARRSSKSNWSKLNKDRVKKLIKNKKMHPSGLAEIKLAKKTGRWNCFDEIDRLVVPDDLMAALKMNKAALKNFSAFPKSSRRIILAWVMMARRSETRSKRIEETVRLAADNIRANHYRQPGAK